MLKTLLTMRLLLLLQWQTMQCTMRLLECKRNTTTKTMICAEWNSLWRYEQRSSVHPKWNKKPGSALHEQFFIGLTSELHLDIHHLTLYRSCGEQCQTITTAFRYIVRRASKENAFFSYLTNHLPSSSTPNWGLLSQNAACSNFTIWLVMFLPYAGQWCHHI